MGIHLETPGYSSKSQSWGPYQELDSRADGRLVFFILLLARGLYSEVKGPEQLPSLQAATITLIKHQQD